MKIRCFTKIDNFSIFKNFDWATNLTYQTKQGQNETYDFKDINIFYGRNYSGKTSLSKIIRALEKKALPAKYENPIFNIKLNDDSEITQNTLSNFQHPIHVYNSDFVKENLKFIHNENENIESFSVTLGGNNQQILDRIKELKNELGSDEENTRSGVYQNIHNKNNEVKNAIENHGSKTRNLEKLLTDKATRNSDSIKNQHSIFGDINYNVGKLRTEIIEVKNSNFQVLTNDQKTEKLALIRQVELPNPPELSTYNLNFQSLIHSTTEILQAVVGSSNKIEELQNNPSLNSWVQTGHPLHTDRTHCVFCTNEISAKRRQELAQHFDQEFQALQNRISKGIGHLTNLLDGENFKINFDISHYYQQYHTELLQLKTEQATTLEKQKVSLKQLKALLEEKSKKPFTELEAEYPQDHSTEIITILEKFSKIRNQCIQLNSELKSQQDEAKNTLRLNHVYDFLKVNNYSQLTTDIEEACQTIAPLKTELETFTDRKDRVLSEIETERAKLKSEGEACNRIKDLLNHEFGHSSLSLEPIEVDTTNRKQIKFEIQRIKDGSKTKAHNLSEGECSLISFCYFLAKIQDELDQDNKPIIWIDDPICSLDSNHIFFIYSLIENKVVQHQNNKQLFISTHNLEFLKYLKRLNGKKWGNSQFYSIIREFNKSNIIQMPIYMKNYFSELNYLFEQLYHCAIQDNINDQNYNLFYNFPNNARKFLELYSNFHYPDGYSNTDREKLEQFWGEDLAFTLTDRINNEYSHLSGIFERSFTPLEQPEMRKASLAILKKIFEINPKQYEGFLKSIGITSLQNDTLQAQLVA